MESENLMPKSNSNSNCCNGDENFALHKLDDNSLLKILSYLRFDDSRNVAKTSKRLKNLWLFRYHKFTFEFKSDMLSKTTERGSTVLDVILSEYGPHIRSFALTILNTHKTDGTEVLRRVSKYCANLKRLEFKGVTDMNFISDCREAATCFANVEVLSFCYCSQIDPADFLQHFRSLKQLHFDKSVTTSENLLNLFKNNPHIESFYCNGIDTFFDNCSEETFSNDFGFGQKIHKLFLGRSGQSTDELDRLPVQSRLLNKMLRLATSTNLTKLKLDLPCVENLNKFLTELAKNGNLKELELIRVNLNADDFNTVARSFQNLQLLAFCPNASVLWPEYRITFWPTSLKYLRTNIPIDFANLLLITGELVGLTHLQIDSEQYVSLSHLEGLVKVRGRHHPTLEVSLHGKLYTVNYRLGTIFTGCTEAGKYDFVGIDFSIPMYPQHKLSKAFAY